MFISIGSTSNNGGVPFLLKKYMIKRKKWFGVWNQRAILCTVNKLFYCFILFRFSAISFFSLSLSVNVEIAVVDTQSCGSTDSERINFTKKEYLWYSTAFTMIHWFRNPSSKVSLFRLYSRSRPAMLLFSYKLWR